MSGKKGVVQKVVQQCVRILREESGQGTQKWLNDSKITSLALRNTKAIQVISMSNYMLQKVLVGQLERPHQLLTLLVEYHKRVPAKCHEYARLVKHFSKWDYEFEYIYKVALDEQLKLLGLYLRVRETVLHSEHNKGKKELLSGVTAELEEWAGLAKLIFRGREEEHVIDQFTTVVKQHYIQIKKSQSEKVNGAQFLRVCQIIDSAENNLPSPVEPQKGVQGQGKGQDQPRGTNVTAIFQQTVLNGLSTQDRELIRVLSYRDKNVARMLEEKHTKMVHMIGQEVNTLRRDINRQKERYVQVVQQKNVLMRLIERMKDAALRYIINRSEASEFELLQLLDAYNKKYNPKALDVAKTTDIINNRRLIEIIEQEQKQVDQM